MTIECDLWPMNILTKPSGTKDRKLCVHPKYAVPRKGMKRKDGRVYIEDEKSIDIPAGRYFLEVKEQGHRHLYCRDSEGNYHIYGRRLNVKQTYNDILPKCKGMPLPDLPKNTVVDFELIFPGHPDSEVVSAMVGGKYDCPEKLRMKAFSIPIYKGQALINERSLSWESGRRLLKKVVGRDNMCTAYNAVEITDVNRVYVLEKLIKKAEDMGIEGWVLKEMACEGWWKLKGIYECDVFITGFKVSDAETRTNMITSVSFSVYNKAGKEIPMGNTSSFDLPKMNDMTEAYNKYGGGVENPNIGRVIRVIYQEMSSKNKLKHGFFDAWRDDKGKESCTLEQFGLE